MICYDNRGLKFPKEQLATYILPLDLATQLVYRDYYICDSKVVQWSIVHLSYMNVRTSVSESQSLS